MPELLRTLLLSGVFLLGCEARVTLPQAISEGDPVAVASAIHRSGDVNARDETGRPLLIIAVENDAEEIVDILLENGADPDAEFLGTSALMLATLAPYCNKEIVSALLDAGVAPNQISIHVGLTPLMGVAASGSEGCFDRLISAGAELGAIDNVGDSIVFHAAIGGNVSILEKVLAMGAAPDSRNVQGVSPLMAAAALGRRDLVVKLIGFGADPCAVDIRDRTPLEIAVQNGHADALSDLLMCPPMAQ